MFPSYKNLSIHLFFISFFIYSSIYLRSGENFYLSVRSWPSFLIWMWSLVCRWYIRYFFKFTLFIVSLGWRLLRKQHETPNSGKSSTLYRFTLALYIYIYTLQIKRMRCTFVCSHSQKYQRENTQKTDKFSFHFYTNTNFSFSKAKNSIL